MSASDHISADQRAELQRYLDELGVWNRRVNLTSVDAADWWARHIDESIALSMAITPAPNTGLVDIGSGGGVPGIPLAILHPDVRVTLVESDVRKAGFLMHVAGLLRLRNVVVLAERAEELGHVLSQREAHDICVSRATAPLAVLCEFGLPLVRPGGRLYAMVRDAAADALDARASAALLGGGVPVATGADIVRVDKVAPTPVNYPRRVGVPLKRPLA